MGPTKLEDLKASHAEHTQPADSKSAPMDISPAPKKRPPARDDACILRTAGAPTVVMSAMTVSATWFAYSPNRKGEHPQQHLCNFRRILQHGSYPAQAL